jgi:hypothetical protein
VIAYNLYLTSTYSMSHAKRFSPPSRDRPFSDAKLFVVCRGSSSMPPSILHPGHILYVCTSSTISFQNIFDAYAKWKARTTYLMDKSKQVSQSIGVPYLHVRLYAHLGSRDKNSVPRAARMSQTTTTPVVAHPGLLSNFSNSPQLPQRTIMLDSYISSTQIPELQQ